MRNLLTALTIFLLSSWLTFAQDSTYLNPIIEDFQVNENAGSAGAMQYNPVSASDSAGNYIVVWTDTRDGKPDLFAQLFSKDGNKLGSNFKVNERELADWGSSDIAMSPSGNFVIIWTELENEKYRVWGQYYDMHGNRINNSFRVLVSEPVNQRTPKVAMDRLGNFIVFWSESEYDNITWETTHLGCYGQRFSTEGQKIGEHLKVVSYNKNPWYFAGWDVSMNIFGEFVFLWPIKVSEDSISYWAQRYKAAGEEDGEKIQLIDLSQKSIINPKVRLTSEGSFAVIWQDDAWEDVPPHNIYAQLFDENNIRYGDKLILSTDSANSWGTEIVLDKYENFNIAWAIGGYYDPAQYYLKKISNDWVMDNKILLLKDSSTTWEGKSTIISDEELVLARMLNNIQDIDIIIQHFSLDGAILGDPIDFVEDTGSANQNEPCIAVDKQGDFIIAWTDYRDAKSEIYFQRVSNDGTLLGANEKTSDNPGIESKITIDGEGNFTIFWIEPEHNTGVFCQQFSKNGEPIGNNRKIVGKTNSQYNVAMNKEGKFVVIWHEYRNNLNIYCQRYNSDGSKFGNEIHVDVHHQSYDYSDIAINNSGDFVILWDNLINFSDLYKYLQRFTWQDGKLGDDIKLTSGERLYNNNLVALNDSGKILTLWNLADGTMRANLIDFENPSIQEIITLNSSPVFPIAIQKNSDDDFLIIANKFDTEDITLQFLMNDGSNYWTEYIPNETEGQRVFSFFEDKIYFAFVDTRGINSGTDIWANVWQIKYPTDIKYERNSELPTDFYLSQNYPNPFNPSTTIKYQIPQNVKRKTVNANVETHGHASVRLVIYDILGKEITTLVNQKQKPGFYEVEWNAGEQPSGIYFYRVTAEDFVETRKAVLLR